MSCPIANRTLELACTVGSVDNAVEAIEEDGADVNFNGGSPMFLAIMNRHRSLINVLLDHDADITTLLSPAKMRPLKTRFLLVEALIACAPHDPKNVKPDEISRVDETVKNDGIDVLIRDIDWDNATMFRDNLGAIGANHAYRAVSDFLHWAKVENNIEADEAQFFIETHEDEILEYRSRYMDSGEDLIALANHYLEDEGK